MSDITESKRQSAFKVWTEALEKYGIKLDQVGEPFRNRWTHFSSRLSEQLLVLVDMLWAISNSLTEKSAPIFAQKVRELVYSRREDEYEMKLSELEVPALLASRVSPIAFEPAVPVEADAAAKPSSSDYSVNVPSGEIFIEATTIDLRDPPADNESLLKRLRGKLDEKRWQAVEDRVYLLAMKVLGSPWTLELTRQLIGTRIWPNPRYRRYGGIISFAQTPGLHGAFQGIWTPNPHSVAPPSKDVVDVILGRRCFHLQRVRNIDCSVAEIASFRRQVKAAWSIYHDIRVPVRLVGGPLNGIEILLKPIEIGDRQITFFWELKGKTKIKHLEFLMPPHGPVKVSYQRETDTLYELYDFKVRIDEWRPTSRSSEYLLQLQMSA